MGGFGLKAAHERVLHTTSLRGGRERERERDLNGNEGERNRVNE